MSFDAKLVPDLVRIASAGGGFTIDGSKKMTPDLVRIAAAGSTTGAKITFTGMSSRLVPDLVRIASAGQGCVIFLD